MASIKPNHYLLSDLHLGHEGILGYCRPWFKTIQDHDDFIIEQICKLTHSDYLWILGDIAWNKKALLRLNEAPCHKGMVGGNHDNMKAADYLEVFHKVKGVATMFKEGYGTVLFTHIPMHPDQMRWVKNIHGHLHTYHVDDDRYINVSCEPMGFRPQRVKDVLEHGPQCDDRFST